LKFNCIYIEDFKEDIHLKNLERLIESVKSAIIERDFLLTLIFEGLNNKTAAKVMMRVEEESDIA
jgi:hypothetical protein